MLWKLTGWHQAHDNICTRFLNVCMCKRKLIDKRQRVGIQPSEESGNTWKLQLLTGQLKERHLVLFWNKLRQTGCLTGSQLLRYCIAEWGGVFGNSLLQLWVKLIHDYRDRGLIEKGVKTERERDREFSADVMLVNQRLIMLNDTSRVQLTQWCRRVYFTRFERNLCALVLHGRLFPPSCFNFKIHERSCGREWWKQNSKPDKDFTKVWRGCWWIYYFWDINHSNSKRCLITLW